MSRHSFTISVVTPIYRTVTRLTKYVGTEKRHRYYLILVSIESEIHIYRQYRATKQAHASIYVVCAYLVTKLGLSVTYIQRIAKKKELNKNYYVSAPTRRLAHGSLTKRTNKENVAIKTS